MRPAFVATALALAIIGAITLNMWVVAKFRRFFDSLHAKLPLPTRVFLAVGHFLATWWYVSTWIGVTLVVIAVLVRQKSRNAGA